MAIFKCVFVFSLANNSWTEVYYRDATNLQTATVFSQTAILSFLRLKHFECTLNKIRVSDVLNLRAAVPININLPGIAPNDKTQGPDITGTAAVVTLACTTNPASRQVWLRGLPDSYTIRDTSTGLDDPPAEFRQSLGLWLGAISGLGFQVRSLTKVANPAVAPNYYTKIDSAAGVVGSGVTTLTLDPGYTPIAPGRIIISRVSPKLLPGMNGHWQATLTDATHITIPYNMPQPGPINLTAGRLRPESYLYGLILPQVSSFNFYRGRKTGKNFLGGRGRRTASRLRSL